jgi:hypothetical protein
MIEDMTVHGFTEETQKRPARAHMRQKWAAIWGMLV